MDIRIAGTAAEIERCHPVMAQLRPDVQKQAFTEQVQRQMANDHYTLAFVEEAGQVRAVAGFRLSECLAWGRFLYVDDLVTDDAQRSKGHGEAMLRWLIDHARDLDCDQLHLDSGVQRFGAHRFYLRHGMDITSHHFAIDLHK